MILTVADLKTHFAIIVMGGSTWLMPAKTKTKIDKN